MTELHWKSATELAGLLDHKEVSAVELARQRSSSEPTRSTANCTPISIEPTSGCSTRPRHRTSAVHRRGAIALRRHPDGAQGPLRHEGSADDVGFAHPRGMGPHLRRDTGETLYRGGPSAPGKAQHGRVRDGLFDREFRIRAVEESVEDEHGPWRIIGRFRGTGRGGGYTVVVGDRHRWLCAPTRFAVRSGRGQADLRAG